MHLLSIVGDPGSIMLLPLPLLLQIICYVACVYIRGNHGVRNECSALCCLLCLTGQLKAYN